MSADPFVGLITDYAEAAPSNTRTGSPAVSRRSPLLVVALLSATGGAAILLSVLLPAWRMSWPNGLLFTVLCVLQLASVVLVIRRPGRQRVWIAAVCALTVIGEWAMGRSGLVPGPNPWAPVDSVIGFTDDICLLLQAVAAAGFGTVLVFGTGERPSRVRRTLSTVAVAPLALVVAAGAVIGVAAASDGFAGGGFPAGTVPPRDLPAGARSTVEYCRPDGMRLAMDIYQPPLSARDDRPAPVAMYIHGGGMVLGDRKAVGLGASLANHDGALFGEVRRALNDRGFVVASIDYRLMPAASWPAPIEDAKCAVRFLRAHASGLGIDPGRIGVWGSSAGGQLCSLLGLAGPAAGFDSGEYAEQSSAVRAVVDMFGPSDLNDLLGADPFARFMITVGYGTSTVVRGLASPTNYVAAGAPPFLILYGTEDHGMPHQSLGLVERLTSAGVPTTVVAVQGAGHGLANPGQRPSPQELTDQVVSFLIDTLR